MTLEERITQDLKAAMRAKDQAALRGVRAVKAAILLAKTEEGADGNISEAKEIQILSKLVKQRQDSLKIYEEQGREDLAVTEREEIAVIQKYLPEQLDAEALATKVAEIITKTGASSMKDMGKVMGIASKELAGKAEGKAISAEVKKQLG